MTKLLFPFLVVFLLTSCSSSKKASEKVIIHNSRSAAMGASKASKIVTNALRYEGTRYRYGGTNERGMDCSGLVFTSFMEESIELPRISRDIATQGMPISLSETIEGDLLFFQTGKNRKEINHVGIVVEVNGKTIKFIHSTTSQGVIISSLEESYWRNSFIEARRII